MLTRLPGRATAPDAAQVMRLFPPRPAGSGWPATRHSREHVLARLLAPPFALDNPAGQAQRRRGLTRMLDWLGSLPGQTWQERWIVSGAEDSSSWRELPDRWLAGAGLTRAGSRPGYGLGAIWAPILGCGNSLWAPARRPAYSRRSMNAQPVRKRTATNLLRALFTVHGREGCP